MGTVSCFLPFPSGSFARQTRRRAPLRANVVRCAAHGEHDGKLQSTTNHFRSFRVPGNLVRRNSRRKRFTQGDKRSAAGWSRFHNCRPAWSMSPRRNDRTTAEPAAPARPAGIGRRRPPSTSRQADRPPQTTARPVPRRAPRALRVPGRSPDPSARKNGTSLPNSAAHSANSSRDRPSRQPSLAATNAAAASLDPPPNPAAAGIRFTSNTCAPRRNPSATPDQLDRSHHKIVGPVRNLAKSRPPRPPTTEATGTANSTSFAGTLLKAQRYRTGRSDT